MKTIELPLSRNYVKSWGVSQAIRELLQNAIDSDAPFRYATNGDTLSIISEDTTLGLQTLVLGSSTKSDDHEKIGQFGEGYKLALLVLTRAGLDIRVENGSLDWVPQFQHSDTYGTEVLHVVETEVDRPDRDLIFRIGGLSHTQMTEAFDSCLLMQDAIEDAIETPTARILPSHPGKLYVSGLYVCDIDMNNGYDFKPQFLELERDRQTVDCWNLRDKVKDAWFSTQRFDEIAVMMEESVPDLSAAGHGDPELVKEACYKLFVKKNPGAVIAASHEERERLVSRGMTVYQSSSRSFYGAVSQSSSYKERSGHLIRVATPQEWVKDWAEKHQRLMSLPLRQAFKTVLSEAIKWKTK